jgi:hypothetical protein
VGVKRPGRDADHSPPSGAEVKECVELYAFMAWCLVQKKYREKFNQFNQFIASSLSARLQYIRLNYFYIILY